MSSSSPLTGPILVDCAKANAPEGVAIAAEQCGYGEDVKAFRAALQKACAEMGVEIEGIKDLITEQQVVPKSGRIISPDSLSEL